MNEVSISQVDSLFAGGSYPIEFLFFYKSRLSSDGIRTALRQLSSDFWPAFGKYSGGTISFDGYLEESHFQEEASGTQFVVPESEDETFQAMSRFALPELKSLFFLKMVHFNNGTLLIPKLNHLAGDGYSYFYFLSALARLSKTHLCHHDSHGEDPYVVPHHRRTALRRFAFGEVGSRQLPPIADLTISFEKIQKTEIRELIKRIRSSHGVRVSANDVLSAFAAKRIEEVQNESVSEYLKLTMPIDVRGSVGAYGFDFFGNGIMLHTVDFRRDFLRQASAEVIATKIRESMPSVSEETFGDYLSKLEQTIVEGRMERHRPYDPDCGCMVTNISMLPVSTLDFGTGIPELVYPTTVERNSIGIYSGGSSLVVRYAY